MAVNDKIKQDEYNNIRNKVVNVLGTGSATRGYGQTVRSAAVTVSNRVTINEWGDLKYDIINAYKHINGAAPTLPGTPTEGATVRYNTSNAPVTYWQTIANGIDTNRFTVHTSQKITTNHGSPTPYTSSWGGNATTVNDELVCTVTCTWSNAAEARYFFNSGGYINFSSTRTGGSTTPQNTAWTSLLEAAGLAAFGGNRPGTGTSPMNGQNFYRLTNSYTSPWFSTSSSSPYGSNTWRIYARTPDVANNSSGTASKVQFLVSWFDGHTGLGGGPDYVDGTVRLSVASLQAFGSMQPPGTPNFEVQTPTVAIGNITAQ